MNVARSSGPELLPPVGSTEQLGTRGRETFSLATEYIEDRMLLRSLYWTLWLMGSLRRAHRTTLMDISKLIPGYRYLLFGFLDPETEANEFGVIVVASFLHEEVSPSQAEIFGEIAAEGVNFPIVVRRVREQLHSPKVHPSGGTAASWARSRISSSSPIGPGVLTAKHVLNKPTGTPVSFSDGTQGQLLDTGPEGIDAALISTQEQVPSNLTRLSVLQYVTPWMDVRIHSRTGRALTTKVTAIPDTFGIYSSPWLPARVALAHSALYGDSGALVSDRNSHKFVGIYMGRYVDPSGRGGGIAQHGFQATELMDMEVYR